jgi:hypothetical protein
MRDFGVLPGPCTKADNCKGIKKKNRIAPPPHELELWAKRGWQGEDKEAKRGRDREREKGRERKRGRERERVRGYLLNVLGVVSD